MRKALENLGRKNIIASLFNFEGTRNGGGKFSDKTINEMVKACYEMGKVKTGAHRSNDEIADDPHILTAIYEELLKGVYI
mgnify:CR=1 FL=1